jgi:hypothetical protein
VGFVFLSHNSADKPAVEEVAHRLRERGIEPWLDAWQLVPGEKWQPALERALAQARCSVIFFGPSGVGPWQEEEMRVAIEQRVRDASYRVIPVLLPGALRGKRSLVPAFMANVTWVEFHESLDEEPAFSRLVAGIEGKAPRPGAGPTVVGTNPYRGLRPFDVEDSGHFFGRQALTGWLVSAIRNSLAARGDMRFLAIVGPSGSGKSSLARAGLLAALREGAIDDSRDWRYTILKPGAHPLEALAIGLSAPLHLADGLAVAKFQDALKDEPRLVHVQASLAMRDSGEGARLLVLVDQFEEVFTLCGSESERAGFIGNLLEAASAIGGPVIVVLTIRSDFVGHCAAYERLAAALSDHQELVGPMGRAELREAIEQPAYMTGVEFQPGLVDTLLEDVHAQPGALPLLQHALFELWRQRDGRRLTHEVYERIGRVQGALARRADDVYATLKADEQDAARRVLLRLTQPGEGTEDTRRRASLEEMATSPADRALVERVVQRLADERLLVTHDGVVDVAHEALIRGWPRLREWIEDQRAALRFHRRITEAVQEWQRLKEDESGLFRGGLLEEARSWRTRLEPSLNARERRFLDESEALARRTLEERTRQRTVSDRMVWLQWGLVNALGLALAMPTMSLAMGGFKSLAAMAPGLFPEDPEPLAAALLFGGVASLLGGILGVVLGTAQWIVVARLIPSLRPWKWIGATAAGASVGMLLAMAVAYGLFLVMEDWRTPADAAQLGALVAGSSIVLLALFVWHRSRVGAPWTRKRVLWHWIGVGAMVAGVAPPLVASLSSDPPRAGPTRLEIPLPSDHAASDVPRYPPMPAVEASAPVDRRVVAAVSGLLAAAVGLLLWHHLSDMRPRSLGRSDLFGVLVAFVAVSLPITFLFRLESMQDRFDGTYGMPAPLLTLAATAILAATIGAWQVLAQRPNARLRAKDWIPANAIGMTVGMAVASALIPELGYSLRTSVLSMQGTAGSALLIYFVPVGLLLGAITGRPLVAIKR